MLLWRRSPSRGGLTLIVFLLPWAYKDHRLLASQGAVDSLDLQLADGGLPSLFFVTTLSPASSSTQVSKIYDY